MAEPSVLNSAASRPPGVFSIEEYRADIRRVMAYAEATGTAAVLHPDGSVYVVISIPTADLPPLEVD